MKNIYLFSEIDSSIRETLGKNACEMIDAEPNSLGFVLTQEACAEFYKTREIEKDLRGRITAVLDGLCSDAGVKFGESATVSIFASTVVPMPGILEKINGVGLNESVLSTLPDEAAQKAWALHLQLMKAFACEMDVSSRHFTDLENEATGKYGVDEIEKLSVEALRELCAAFKSVYAVQGVCSLSTDPYEQFFMLLKTAFRSWDNPRACMYRGMKGITDSGLSIAVQLVDLKTGKHFKNRTTIAAADRNNKEKDASNKSAPQAEFKRIEYDGGDVYEGETRNGKRHGHGTYTWADGDFYEGDWKDGKRCGRGKLIQYGKVPATGETYVKRSYDGEWLDSKEHGHGICVEGDFGMEKMDKVFEGEWVNGKRQGRFVWYYTNSKGGRYINFYEDGKWIEGGIPYDESIKTVEDARRARALADGKSSSTTPVYTNSSPAATQDSADNGGDETEESDTGDNVLLRYQNGDSYRGAAVGGVREGFGAYFYADDGYYRGTFHQGVFHGYGIREYGNGHTYKGMWKNDTKNGYGEYTFADGRSYFGWWKDDCFQGFGCMTLSGGEVYVGEYENHKENGIFLYNRGNKWSGYKAADGKVIGSSAGRWTAYKDGSEYCGPIIERRRGNTIYRVKEGFGEYCFPDDDSECPSDRYLGQFKDDMPYGTGIRLYTSPETDMPIIMASNDFRGDIIPRGHFQSVCGIKDPSGNCDFFLYYVGECKDSVCYGRGVMYVIGTTERSRYTPYGVKGGSIIYCDTFREHPDGPATVINRYGEELHGRFVDGMFEQYK